MADYRITLRKDTAANWASANPTLADGEPAFESDSLNLKIGDGTTAYNALEYYAPTISQTVTRIEIEVRLTTNVVAGDVLMFAGVSGGKILATLADTSSPSWSPDYIIGVSGVAGSTNDDIDVTEFGPIPNINTSAFSAGDILYIDPAQAGKLTNVKPSAPNYSGSVAAVLIAQNNGELLVRPTTAFKLENIVDVDLTTPATNGQFLSYSSASETWGPVTLPAEVNDLTATVTWANVPDANITESSVTQHQAALSITESQISDLQSYLTAVPAEYLTQTEGDARYLQSFTETNDLTTAVTWANVPDANITESSVTQHEAALTITESQISDLQAYLTAVPAEYLTQTEGDARYLQSFTEANDLTASVTWANVPDANITQTSVTQHQAALSITESQISDLQSYLTAVPAEYLTQTEGDARYLQSYTETNDLTAAVTWANVPDANITQSSVTQHQAALSITESQISDLDHYADADVDAHLNTATATNGQVLSYTGSDYDWIDAGSGGGATELDDLTDVDLTTTAPTSGQVLSYDGTNWVPADGGSAITNPLELNSDAAPPPATADGSFSTTTNVTLVAAADMLSTAVWFRTQITDPVNAGDTGLWFGLHQSTTPIATAMIYGSYDDWVYDKQSNRTRTGILRPSTAQTGDERDVIIIHTDASGNTSLYINNELAHTDTLPNLVTDYSVAITQYNAGMAVNGTYGVLNNVATAEAALAAVYAVQPDQQFKFDGDTTNAAGSDTLTIAGSVSYGAGYDGTANSAVVLTSSQSVTLNSPSITAEDDDFFIGFWFKSDGTTFPSSAGILHTGYVGGNLLAIMVTVQNSTTQSLSLADYTGGNWQRAVASVQPIWTDWNHYAISRSGDSIYLYLNGVPVAEQSAVGDTYPTGQWLLGKYTTTVGGSYDDWRFYASSPITHNTEFNPEAIGGGSVKIAEIEATGNITDSVLTFKQYESGVLTSYTLAELAAGGLSAIPNPLPLKKSTLGAPITFPTMTAATTGDWTLTESDKFAGGYEFWRSFDVNPTDGSFWHTQSTNAITNGSWVQFQNSAGDPFLISSFTSQARAAYPSRTMTGCKLQGSTDGVSFTDIETVNTGTVPSAGQAVTINFNTALQSSGSYTYMRLVVTEQNGNTTGTYCEMESASVSLIDPAAAVDADIGFIEATGTATDSELNFKKYEGGSLTSYTLSQLAASTIEKQYSYQGALEANVSTFRLYLPSNVTGTTIAAYLGTASSSGSVDVAVKIDGSSDTTFSVAQGATSATASSSTAISAGSYVTIDITDAGTGASDLYVLLSFAR